MGGLLEVDVGNAILADVVVFDQAELGTRGNGLDQLGGGVDVSVTSGNPHGVGGGLGADVLGRGLEAEGVQVDGPAAQVGLVAVVAGGMGVDVQRGAEEAEEQRGTHLDRAVNERSRREMDTGLGSCLDLFSILSRCDAVLYSGAP